MGQTAAQLRQEIAAKRGDAAAKIDQIEAKVHDIPQIARETVDASLQQAKATVGETVGQMAHSMGSSMGQMTKSSALREQIEARPVVAFGVALAGGWVLGKLLAGDDGAKAKKGGKGKAYRSDRDAAQAGSSMNAMHGASTPLSQGGGYAAASSGGQKSGVVESIRGAARDAGLDDTLQAFTGALVATLADQLRRAIDQSFPGFGDKLREQEQANRQGQTDGPGDRSAGTAPFGAATPAGGSGSASGTSGAGATAGGAIGGAGTGPGEGSGYATATGHGTGAGYGTGASAGSYTDGPSGTGGGTGASASGTTGYGDRDAAGRTPGIGG